MSQPEKNSRPTAVKMADVAAMAGVSPTTVARALYSNGYISEENRKLVEAAIAETGYRPNVMARALRTKRSSTIGMVLSEANRNPFYTAIAHAVQIEAIHQGYSILSFNHNFSEQAEREGVRRFLDQHVDAVIYCHAYAPADIKSVRDAKVPVVQIEREIIKGGHRCLVDPAPGMTAAVARLKQAGHTHIGFIGGKPGGVDWEIAVDETVEAKRVEAFKTALHAEGLSVDKASMVFSSYYSLQHGAPLQGYLLMKKLLQLSKAPTAVISGSDILAAGALQALHEAGMKVPDDMSLVGFDDTLSEYMSPALTSIAQPIAALGRSAIKLAIAAINNDRIKAKTEIFPTHLVERGSITSPR